MLITMGVLCQEHTASGRGLGSNQIVRDINYNYGLVAHRCNRTRLAADSDAGDRLSCR